MIVFKTRRAGRGLFADRDPGTGCRLSGAEAGRLGRQDFRFHTGEVMPEVRLHYTTRSARLAESRC